MTQCTAQTTFDFFHRLPVIVRSDAPDISSDAGALLLRQLDDEMGLTRLLAEQLPDDRRADRVDCVSSRSWMPNWAAWTT